MYEVGKVYIWQNMHGTLAVLNGTECIVTGGAGTYRNISSAPPIQMQPTDTRSPRFPDLFMCAGPGDLRPKNPPPGEQSVRDLFATQSDLVLA